MNRRLLILVLLVGMVCGGLAQTSTSPNAGSRLEHDPFNGIYTLYWWGHSGTTYFIQHTEDLTNWTYLQEVRSGANALMGQNFETNADRSFWRLVSSDFSTTNSRAADFDSDHVSNLQELLNGTDPLQNADSDFDGFSNDWESTHGLNSQVPDDPASDEDEDGLTLEEEYEAGSDPTEEDTDGDGAIDGEDVSPADPDLKQPRVKVTRYAVIDLGSLGFLSATAINDSFQILDNPASNPPQARLWTDGQFAFVPNPDGVSSWLNSLSNTGLIATDGTRETDPELPPESVVYAWSPTLGLSMLSYSSPLLAGYDETSEGSVLRGVAASGVVLGYCGGNGFKREAWVNGEPYDYINYGGGLRWAGGGGAIIGAQIVYRMQEDGDFNIHESWTSGLAMYHPLDENNAGLGVGWGQQVDSNGVSSSWKPALFQSGASTFLAGDLSSYGAGALSINNATPLLIAGYDSHSPQGYREDRAVMWAQVEGVWKQKNLGPYDPESQTNAPVSGTAYKVNDRCEIVGDFQTPVPSSDPAYRRDTFWQNGKVVDLESRTSGYYDFYARTINNQGAILAYCKRTEDDQSVNALLLPVDIVPDFNRDGVINDQDRGKVTEADPWRWWLNDDDDNGEVKHNDVPLGQSNGSNDSFLGNSTVDGSSDLLDFFPLYFDIKKLIEVLPPEQAEYRLVHENAAVSFTYTDLTAGEAGKYLRDAATAEQLKSAHTYIAFANGANRLSNEFLNKIKNEEGKGVLLIEASNTSDKPMRLEVWKGGQRVAEVKFPMKSDGVEKMYRWVNLRGVANGGSVGRATDTGEPPNRPDRLTTGKHFVFVHGYNVSEDAARGWNSEMFKRLYQSQLRAKFTALVWRGNQGQWIGTSITPDYWENVTNAFITSPHVASAVNALAGTKIVAGHSLGNMVVTSAIKDHGLSASKYYQVDAAVALQAYDQTMEQKNQMRYPDWQHATEGLYPDRLWAANWYWLFPASDGRSKLTWRQRFGPVANAHNFYSTGEEVLNNSEGTVPGLGAEKSWTLQEMVKGTGHIGAVLTADSQAGWGFNFFWDKQGRRRLPSETTAAELSDDALRYQPFFREFRDTRLTSGADGSAAANEYHTRAKTLAEGISSLSFAAGRNSIDNYEDENTDMMTLKTGWPRGDGRWLHSDAGDVAFRYNHQLFKRWIDLGGLK
jgi:hypothetical protein